MSKKPAAWLYRGTSMGDVLEFHRLDHFHRPKFPAHEHDYVKGVPLVEQTELGCIQAAADQLVAACTELLSLLDQFYPHLAKIPLQNYQQLNEAPIAARAAIKLIEELQKEVDDEH